MRFQQYILQEGRGTNLDLEDAIGIIQDYCMQAYNGYINGSRIYRGIQYDTDYYFVDPKAGKPRVSANTKNYYTLINDNSPYWKGYPKRSESLICTTNRNVAIDYGVSYVVLPYNGAKIGVCPSVDYWFSFEKTTNNILDQLNKELKRLVESLTKKPLPDKDFNKMKKVFKEFDKEFKKFDSKEKKIYKESIRLLKGYNENEGLLKHLQKLLSPEPNGFKLKKVGDKLPNNKEVWTDSKSVLIKEDKMHLIEDNI